VFIYVRVETKLLIKNFSKMKKTKTTVITTDNVNNLLFPVEKVDTEIVTGMPANSDYSHLILVGEQGSKKIVNACSKRYELVPISDFAPQIREIIMSKGLEFEENYTMRDHAVFTGELIIKDTDFYIGDNPEDTLNMRVQWMTSYNGLVNYEMNVGTFYRYLCENGLWMTGYDTKKYGLSITGRHTIKIQDSLRLLEQKLNYVLSSDVKEKYKETMRPLYEHWIENIDERVTEVLKIAGIGATKNNIEIINGTLQEESNILYDGKINDWLVYNAVNKFLFDNTNNVMLEPKRRATDNKVLTHLLQTV